MTDILERLRQSGKGGWNAEAADEIERLQEAKRRALAIADERSKENVRLRAERDAMVKALQKINYLKGEPKRGPLLLFWEAQDIAREALTTVVGTVRTP